MTNRPLYERAGISNAAWDMLQYLQRIARSDTRFAIQDVQLNHRCNVTPSDDFHLITQLFDAGKVDFDYRVIDGFTCRYLRLV